MFCLRSWPQINFARAIEMAQQWQRVMAPAQLTHAANRKDLFYASRCKHFAKHIIKWNTWNKSKSMKHSNAVLIQFNIFKLFISLFFVLLTDNRPVLEPANYWWRFIYEDFIVKGILKIFTMHWNKMKKYWKNLFF